MQREKTPALSPTHTMSRIFGSNRPSVSHPSAAELSQNPHLTDSFIQDIIQKKRERIHQKFLQFTDSDVDRDGEQYIKRANLEAFLEEECGLDTQYDLLRSLLDYYCSLQGGNQQQNHSGMPESQAQNNYSAMEDDAVESMYSASTMQDQPQAANSTTETSTNNASFSSEHHRFPNQQEHPRLDRLNMYQFTKLLTDKNIIQKAIDHELAIPHFREFVEDVICICKESERVQEGQVPDYIPELKNVNPEDFAVSICTVDGQHFSYGDSGVEFTLQAAVLPLMYCLALEQHGKKIKDYLGREPSGARFNDFVLTEDNKPHNSLVSTGGILTCSLIEPKEPWRASERYGKVNSLLSSMSASKNISFNQRVYLSEKSHSDRNAALAYYMRGQGTPGMEGNISDILDFYYQCCSMATTTKVLSEIGATLANSGVNCFTQKRVLRSSTVRQTLSVMYTCGLADSSGEWAFNIGLPAKSGIAGGMLVVVPNVCGIAVYSPKVNEGGHSVRAIDFCRRLINKFSFSIFDQLVDGIISKSDPTIAHET